MDFLRKCLGRVVDVVLIFSEIEVYEEIILLATHC